LKAVTLPLQGKKGVKQPMIDDSSEGGRKNDTGTSFVQSGSLTGIVESGNSRVWLAKKILAVWNCQDEGCL